MELNVTLARTLLLYDIQLAPESACCARTPHGGRCEYKMKSWAVMAREGPIVQFRRARST